jgi:Zn-dependent protease
MSQTDTPTAEAPPAAPPRRGSPFVAPLILLVWLGLAAALAAADGSGPLVFAFVLVGWVLSVMVHEFGHAIVAYWAGDHTVAANGYLTMDPRRYTDLGVSLLLPLAALALGGIGFPGGAVYLRNDLMRSRLWRSAASLAGPLGTALVLLALTTALRLWPVGEIRTPLFAAVSFLAFLQATALVLNLLPIPGLDGFNALRPYFPEAWRPAIRRLEGLAFVLLLAVIFLVPGAGAALFGAAADIAFALGLRPDALAAGYELFRFWT